MLTDPTYLRYIVDGLDSKSINQENISALPEGLIGIYEEALPPEHNVKGRERFLSFFSTWALLKKDVSASLVSEILNWTEQDVIDCLSIYTKWFNSPTTGTYILYHERLRVFLLEKVSSQQLHLTNQKIISLYQRAFEQRNADEWELYALEHLPSHLLIPAMQHQQDGVEYRKLVNDTGFWNRQVEISKGYDWTKKMLNQSMVWAAKQSTDELIECALNNVDLYYLEQNDAPRIVELVAQNDIETVLQRIDAFGGNDKEGLQRKFSLYMICLMELTLLDCKDKPFRKSSIEKLLNHLDVSIPVDHSLLKWNDFFPSYLMFQMACKWVELGLDYLRVYKRTDEWSHEWIAEKGPFTDFQLELLMSCARGFWDESALLSAISAEFAKQCKLDEAFACVEGISFDYWKSNAFNAISAELVQLGKIKEADSVMQEALICTTRISVDRYKSIALSAISTELAKQGKLEDSASAMQEAFTCARGISEDRAKSNALSAISAELSKQGKVEEALTCARDITNESYKIDALKIISAVLSKQGKLEEALSYAGLVKNDSLKVYVIKVFSVELAKQGRIEDALIYARGISFDDPKIEVLTTISAELSKQDKIEESVNVMQEALTWARGIRNENGRSNALNAISAELAKQGYIEKALACAREIGDEIKKSYAIWYIIGELEKQDKIEQSYSAMDEALIYNRGIISDRVKNKHIKEISAELAKQGYVEEALSCARGIIDVLEKSYALESISAELAKQGKIEEALSCARGIDVDWRKSEVLKAISAEQVRQGKHQESASAMQESLSCARGISIDWQKISALTAISAELVKQNKHQVSESVMQEALSCAIGISDDIDKIQALTTISAELAKQFKHEESASAMQDALTCVRGISVNWQKNSAFKAISIELAKQGKIKESLIYAREISDDWSKWYALKDISAELFNQGQKEEASSALQEALVFASGLSDESNKIDGLTFISAELAKQGKIEEAISCILEISYDYWRSIALKGIITELAKQSKIEAALVCARTISDESCKSEALSSISGEISKQGHVEESEDVALEIPQIEKRYTCWKQHAENALESNTWQSALSVMKVYKSNEAHRFYLKGWSEHLSVKDLTHDCVKQSLSFIINDSESLELFMQTYAQHELFFGNPSQEKINRLNKTLNLQWALDIIAQFPKE